MSVDLNITLDGSAPPAGLIFPFLDVNIDVFAFIALDFSINDIPISLLRVNFVFPFAINQSYSINDDNQFIKSDSHFQILLSDRRIQEYVHLQVLNR